MRLRLALILLICTLACRVFAAEAPHHLEPELLLQTGHQREVHSMAFSPDGRALVTSSADGTVKLWDVPYRKLLRTLEVGGRGVTSLRWSPDGSRMAGLGDGGVLFLWSRDGEQLRRWTLDAGQAYGVTLLDRDRAVIAGRGFVTLLNTATSQVTWSISLNWGEVMAVTAAKGGAIGVIGSNLGSDDPPAAEVAVLDPVTGALLKTASIRAARFVGVCPSPDGKQFAVFGLDYRTDRGAVWIVDVNSGRIVCEIHPGASYVYSAAFSATGQSLIVGCDLGGPGSECGCVQRWSLQTGFKAGEWRTPGLAYVQVAVSPISGTLAVVEGSGEMPIRFVDPVRLRVIASLPHFRSNVSLGDPSPDGRQLAISGANAQLLLWDRETGRLRELAPPLVRTARWCCWAPDGATLITNDTKVQDGLAVADARTGKQIVSLAESKGLVVGLEVSPDGKRATGFGITSLQEHQILGDTLLWDTHTGELIHRFRLTKDARLSPSGKYLAGFALDEMQDGPLRGHYAQALTIWDATSGALVRDLGEATDFQFVGSSDQVLRQDKTGFAICGPVDGSVLHMGPPVDLYALSSDGARLVVAGSSEPIRLIDTRTGRYLRSFPTLDTSFRSLALSPDSKYAFLGADEAGAFLLNLESGEKRILGGDTTKADSCRSVEFGTDGRTVLGTYWSGVRLWDVASGGLLLSVPSGSGCKFAPDGNSLLMETLDGTLRIYDAHSGKERITFASFPKTPGHPQREWLAYTPDGRYTGSPGAERFIAWRSQGRILPGSAERGSRIPDLLKCVPWSFGARQAKIEEAEALFTQLPYWLSPPHDDPSQTKLLRGLEALSHYDNITLREVIRRTELNTAHAGASELYFWFNGMVLNRYLFVIPLDPKRPQYNPTWPLYGDTQGRVRLDRDRGWGGSPPQPLWEFDWYRTYYRRRPPESPSPAVAH